MYLLWGVKKKKRDLQIMEKDPQYNWSRRSFVRFRLRCRQQMPFRRLSLLDLHPANYRQRPQLLLRARPVQAWVETCGSRAGLHMHYQGHRLQNFGAHSQRARMTISSAIIALQASG